MSIFDTAAAICPVCGTEAEVDIVVSVNADRRPELRQQILDGTFQAVPCSNCGAKVRLPPEFVYFELKRGRWIATYPAEAVAQWQQAETQAGATYESAFGSGASPAICELAQGKCRVLYSAGLPCRRSCSAMTCACRTARWNC